MSQRDAFIEKLKSAHAFPGPYTFKIIGTNVPDFMATVESALSEFVIQESTHRFSKNGNHISVSLKVLAPTPDSVLDAYEILGKLDLVKYVL